MPDPVGGREAEIEAVARALQPFFGHIATGRVAYRELLRPAAIAALDAVGSGSAAQNQEQGIWPAKQQYAAALGRDLTGDESCAFRQGYLAARSPQDEDHEA